MQEAASDELFLADLNETMEDFGHTDREDHEFLTVDRLAGLPRSDSWSEQGKTRPVLIISIRDYVSNGNNL